MIFPYENEKVICTLVSINMNERNTTHIATYYYGIFYFNTGTWWCCDEEKITLLRRFPDNVYQDESDQKTEKEKKNDASLR